MISGRLSTPQPTVKNGSFKLRKNYAGISGRFFNALGQSKVNIDSRCFLNDRVFVAGDKGKNPRSRGLTNHGYQPCILNGMILQGLPALV